MLADTPLRPKPRYGSCLISINVTIDWMYWNNQHHTFSLTFLVLQRLLGGYQYTLGYRYGQSILETGAGVLVASSFTAWHLLPYWIVTDILLLLQSSPLTRKYHGIRLLTQERQVHVSHPSLSSRNIIIN